jgi:Predicted secreted hydrolase
VATLALAAGADRGPARLALPAAIALAAARGQRADLLADAEARPDRPGAPARLRRLSAVAAGAVVVLDWPSGNRGRPAFRLRSGVFTFNAFLFMRDQLVQAAITDVNGQRFTYTEFVRFGLPNRSANGFKLSADRHGSISAVGGNGHDRLHSAIGDYILDLDLQATKPPALHYSGDPHPYVFGGYTYYYSRPQMTTTGTLQIAGKTHRVSGTSWFDRQYGELFQAIAQGWQWFAIELADNRQIMLFDFQGDDASVENPARSPMPKAAPPSSRRTSLPSSSSATGPARRQAAFTQQAGRSRSATRCSASSRKSPTRNCADDITAGSARCTGKARAASTARSQARRMWN